MAELRVVMNRQPGSLAMPSETPTIWMTFTALDFARMAGGAPALMARWRWCEGRTLGLGSWVRWD